jgi:hypothetical protein
MAISRHPTIINKTTRRSTRHAENLTSHQRIRARVLVRISAGGLIDRRELRRIDCIPHCQHVESDAIASDSCG